MTELKLYDHQKQLAREAYNRLIAYNIAYLCMEVRTGKTLTALEAARLYGAKKVLFVTKLKAISSINKDYESTGKHFSLYLINYESLHKCESGFDLIILDEAHCLGQFPKPSERTKELKRICYGKPVIFLSGTPSPESYSQFFHQFHVSSYSPWKEYETFYKWHKDYGVPKTKFIYNRQIADYSVARKEAVSIDIEKYIIAYTQEQAGFKSMVEDKIIKIPMSDKIKWCITKLRKDKVFKFKTGSVVVADTAVKEMQKVHQLCNGTVICEDKVSEVFDYTKAEYVRDKFEGQKIGIFYKYQAEKYQLLAIFGNRITEDPQEFNKAGKDKVFISQEQSGREGINISTADCLVMYNIAFSAVSYWQARARLQLKERTDPSYVYWIFTEGGIEEKIYETVVNKKDYTLSHYKRFTISG